LKPCARQTAKKQQNLSYKSKVEARREKQERLRERCEREEENARGQEHADRLQKMEDAKAYANTDRAGRLLPNVPTVGTPSLPFPARRKCVKRLRAFPVWTFLLTISIYCLGPRRRREFNVAKGNMIVFAR
jgi:short subunit dehydrogenase-like uncharacterized protein